MAIYMEGLSLLISSTPIDDSYMKEALKEAETAIMRGDRPIGAVIVHRDRIVGRGSNAFSSGLNDIAHAEINAIYSCAAYLQKHGRECIIYTTCEPCVMCLGAIVMANIREIVFGMPDNYIQGRFVIDAVPYIQQRVQRYTGGVLQEECAALMRDFSEAETDACLLGPGHKLKARDIKSLPPRNDEL
jgi:tRNA(adenine34) deaminase